MAALASKSRRVRVLVTAIALGAVALPASVADATRAPTSREARAIRSAALRTLHGGGWTVTRIRVSTAHTTNRYASAVVTNRATGVGGSMILGTRNGTWRRRFLGTDGFCETLTVPHVALVDLFRCPDVSVSPTRVVAGGTLTVSGRNWPAGTAVEVLVGPARSEADPVGTTTATTGGRFTFRFTLNATLPAGRYAVLGCQDACRSKAGAPFTIVAGAR